MALLTLGRWAAVVTTESARPKSQLADVSAQPLRPSPRARRYASLMTEHAESDKAASEDRDDQAEAKCRVAKASAQVAAWSADLNRRLS